MDNSIIRVTIIEDRLQSREAMKALIERSGDYRVADVFGTVEEALPRMGMGFPDIVLLNIGLLRMPGLNGIRILRDRYPNLLFMVLPVFADDAILKGMHAGASGEIEDGCAVLAPRVARRPQFDQLTPHETRLLKLLAEGHTYKTAAVSLGVTPHTVSFHLRHIYEKLQVHSKSEAVCKALRCGLVR